MAKDYRKVFPNTVAMLRRMGKTDKEIRGYLNTQVKIMKSRYGRGRK